MTLDIQGVLGDAWRLWRRDRGALIPIAGVFFFLPQFALRLFVLDPAPPKRDTPPALGEMLATIQQFYIDHAPILIAAELWSLGGALAVLAFYLHAETQNVRGVLATTLRLAPRYVLMAVALNIALGIGFALLILPGYYLIGRLILSGPILVAEQPVSAFTAIERSWTRTHGRGFLLAGLGVFATILGYLVGLPVEAIGQALDRAPLANPVSAALIEAAGAAIVAAALLATVLIRVAVYRRLVR